MRLSSRTLSVERLEKKIGKTSSEELHQIVEGLDEIIRVYYPGNTVYESTMPI